jgi:hypothetical protein
MTIIVESKGIRIFKATNQAAQVPLALTVRRRNARQSQWHTIETNASATPP